MAKRRIKPASAGLQNKEGPEISGPDRRATAPAAAQPAVAPPYPPSWYDRLARRIDRLPGPSWLAYALLGLTGVLVQAGLQTLAGPYQPGKHILFHLWTAAHFAYLLGLMRFLDRSAAAALDVFRPVLELPRQTRTASAQKASTLVELHYRLTTLPPRPTLWAALAGAILGIGLPMAFIRVTDTAGPSLAGFFASFGFSSSPAGMAAFFIQLAFTQAVVGVLVYHSIHQLREISRIYLTFARLNLYRLQPLYAFSVPAALTSGGLILYSYGWFAGAPELVAQPISIALGVFFAAIASVIFAWPLLGIHRRLVMEKKRCLAENAHRFEAVAAELHQRIDKKTLTRMDDLNRTLSTLEIERAALQRIPTWPWEAGTLRGVVAALVLPIVIWLVQFVLTKLLG